MAIQRKLNWLGQQRVEVSHLRLVESAVAGDFDALAGLLIGNAKPYVVKGLTIPPAPGAKATTLLLKVAGALFVNWKAAESGSLFHLDYTAPDEILSATNSRVVGGFAPSSTNYVSLDVVSIADPASVDQVKFKDAIAGDEFTSSVPVSRVIDWRIYISTSPFSTSPGRLPIAKVVTDGSNNVTSLTDARYVLWRLALGGDAPGSTSYVLATENASTSTTTSDPFVGGDKAPVSLKEWMDAVMTKLWNATGGQHWYSATTGNQYKVARTGAPFANGEYFSWDGGSSTLSWKGLSVMFEGGTNNAYYNTITDGSIVLAAGEALAVDLDFSSNAALSVAGGAVKKVALASFSGRSVLLAWRNANGIYTRDNTLVLGAQGGVATTSAYGLVKLLSAPTGADTLVAVVDSLNTNPTYQSVLAMGVTRGGTGGIVAGTLKVGHGANDSAVEIGRAGITTTVLGNLTAANIQGNTTITGSLTVASLDAGSGAIATTGAITGATVTTTGKVTAGAGLKSTGTAALAALNLVPQATPSGLADGDIWIQDLTNDALKVRLSGATHTVMTAERDIGLYALNLSLTSFPTTFAGANGHLNLYTAAAPSGAGTKVGSGVDQRGGSGADSNRIQVSKAGTYRVRGWMSVKLGATSLAQGAIYVNGANPAASGPETGGVAGLIVPLVVDKVMTLSANDYVELGIYGSGNGETIQFYSGRLEVQFVI